MSKLAEFLVAEGVVDDISHEGLRVLLREEGVSFQVIKTFKVSNDPDFEAKKNRVLELYDIADGKAPPGPDDPTVVICIGGQKGIHNNVSVDGADFNNPFFGEQRGGQRPAFTFNLDAVQDFVVVADGANAEFGRSSGGFVNVITKSGTNEFHGSAHYFGKYDALSGDYSHTFPGGGTTGFAPDFTQHQFGATFGGPLCGTRRSSSSAYDHQEYNDLKQTDRLATIDPRARRLHRHRIRRVLQGEFGSIARTNDADALLAKFDFRLSPKHSATLKYNYTRSSQQNGTFDVDSWGRSANALEKDHSHAVNGSLTSLFSSAVSNEFRFQVAREDRPRPYTGADQPVHRAPVSRYRIGFVGPAGSRVPHRACRSSFRCRPRTTTGSRSSTTCPSLRGNHLFKVGAEWNRTGVNQTFLGFANGRIAFTSVDGFLNYAANGSTLRGVRGQHQRTASQTTGACPAASKSPAGRPLPPAGRRRGTHGRGGGHPDTLSSTSSRCSSRTAGSRGQPDGQLRAPLGGADRAPA